MKFFRVYRMWYRIFRNTGFSRRQALVMARSMLKPTVDAIDQYGGLD